MTRARGQIVGDLSAGGSQSMWHRSGAQTIWFRGRQTALPRFTHNYSGKHSIVYPARRGSASTSSSAPASCVILSQTLPMADQNATASAVLGMYFACWSIRYSAGLNYKLSRRARLTRWLLVVGGFGLTYLPGSNMAIARVTSGFVGLVIFCWPNFAYRLDKLLFRDWPQTRAIVESSQSDSGGVWRMQYSFYCNGERRGGRDRVRTSSANWGESEFPVGSSVAIQYDPLNPGESRVVPSTDKRTKGTEANA